MFPVTEETKKSKTRRSNFSRFNVKAIKNRTGYV